MARLGRDEAALLKAVCRNKSDDLPRLVYADWLDEHDRPERAEFIRLQCASAAAGFTGKPFEYENSLDPRQQRIEELWRSNWQKWVRELPKWAFSLPDRATPAFVRGFGESFALVAAPFLRYGPQLLDRTPVRTLQLRQMKNVIAELVRCVWFREVPELYLCDEDLGDEWVAELMHAEWLTATRLLNLKRNNLRDDSARFIARCPYLAGVELLNLVGNRITIEGIQTLASSRYLNPRAVIHLWSNPALDDRPEAVRRILGDRGRLRPTFPC